MCDLYVSNEEIEGIEKDLLPKSCHFSEDARRIIRCWKSTDIVACPGSGKTTVLLAKLRILAERMSFSDGTGICVLSHTNVAVNEIKTKLNRYAGKLIGYPNYIGTIQSFVDLYITKPYLKNVKKTSVQVIDDFSYAKYFYDLIWSENSNESSYCKLRNLLSFKSNNASNHIKNQVEYIQKLYLRDDGLFVKGTKKAIAKNNTDSVHQFIHAKESLLKEKGIITYSDAYKYAVEAISNLSAEYTELFSRRFKYVFVDEYQDCNSLQRKVLNRLFDKDKTCVFYIGDPDQAIYNSEDNIIDQWIPDEDYIEMYSSNRYGQEIADILSNLRAEKRPIESSKGYLGYVPTLIVFDEDSRNKVIEAFIHLLNQYKLYDPNGVYKVIGLVKREELKGLKIGDYWDGYNSKQNMLYLDRYWNHIYLIAIELEKGKLYSVEKEVRKILCKLFEFMGIIDPETGLKYTVFSMRKILLDKYRDIYSCCFINLTTMRKIQLDKIHTIIVHLVNEIIGKECNENNLLSKIPCYYLDKSILNNNDRSQDNILVEKRYNRKISFDTVHGVKGETHDATLYVETEKNRSSDIKRVIPFFGTGKLGKGPDVERSRKCVYVGLSRPSKLLCLAVQESTYTKLKDVFSKWEIVDCRCK